MRVYFINLVTVRPTNIKEMRCEVSAVVSLMFNRYRYRKSPSKINLKKPTSSYYLGICAVFTVFIILKNPTTPATTVAYTFQKSQNPCYIFINKLTLQLGVQNLTGLRVRTTGSVMRGLSMFTTMNKQLA